MWRFEAELNNVWNTVEQYLEGLAHPLPDQWKDDEEGLCARCKVSSMRELTRNREMFPSIPMIWWTGHAMNLTDPNVLHDLSTGALLAYLYFRFQDDVMDGHARTAGGLLTGNLCMNRFHRIYQGYLQEEHLFWDLWEEVLSAYSATTLWEARNHRKRRQFFTTPDLARLGEKFIPVLAPCAGVAFLAGRVSSIPDLKELILLMGTGLQLINDYKGIEHDFHTRNYTSVISDVLMGVPEVPELESAMFPRRAMVSEALEQNLLRSGLFFEQARYTAQRLGMEHAVFYIQENLDHLSEEMQRVSSMRATAREMELGDLAGGE